MISSFSACSPSPFPGYERRQSRRVIPFDPAIQSGRVDIRLFGVLLNNGPAGWCDDQGLDNLVAFLGCPPVFIADIALTVSIRNCSVRRTEFPNRQLDVQSRFKIDSDNGYMGYSVNGIAVADQAAYADVHFILHEKYTFL